MDKLSTAALSDRFERLSQRQFKWTMGLRLFSIMSRLPGAAGRSAKRKFLRRLMPQIETENRERLAHFCTTLSAKDYVIDLGAHHATFTITVAKTGANVIAYEPDPINAAAARAAIAHLAGVELRQQAVARHGGQMPLSRPNEAQTQSSSIIVTHEHAGAQSFNVDVVAFADVLRTLPQRPRLIKMDIEGAELEILEGLRDGDIPMRFDRLWVETHEMQMPQHLARFQAIRQWARSLDGQIDLEWH